MSPLIWRPCVVAILLTAAIIVFPAGAQAAAPLAGEQDPAAASADVVTDGSDRSTPPSAPAAPEPAAAAVASAKPAAPQEKTSASQPKIGATWNASAAPGFCFRRNARSSAVLRTGARLTA